MSLLTGENYDVVVIDPDDGNEITVTLKRLNANDKAALDDSLRMQFEDEGRVRAEMKLGTWRMLTVQRAVVDWDSPLDPKPTPGIIANLKPDIFEQLYEAIEANDAGVPPPDADDPTRGDSEETKPEEASSAPEPQTADRRASDDETP
jgi:hypothetical protein